MVGRSKGNGREGGRRRGANRWGPGVSDRGKIRKEERGRGPLRVGGKWAGGPLG
jgi:hypothetical protein